jgi:hypothetical protein
MKTIVISLSLAVGWLAADAAVAAEPCKTPGACAEVQTCGGPRCCANCGSACQCEKRCQVVCQMKEVKKTVWVVRCEEFCPLLPRCGHGGCKGCDGCGSSAGTETCESPGCREHCGKKCDPCAAEKNKHYVPPKCGKMRTKKILEKKEVVCLVPSYKCVVVYACPSCCGSQNGDEQAPAAPTKPATPPPPPQPDRNAERAPLSPEFMLTR